MLRLDGTLGAGNCSTPGPVLLHEFANPASGSLPARWRGLTWCPRPPRLEVAGPGKWVELSKIASSCRGHHLCLFKFVLARPLPAPQSKPLHGPS